MEWLGRRPLKGRMQAACSLHASRCAASLPSALQRSGTAVDQEGCVSEAVHPLRGHFLRTMETKHMLRPLDPSIPLRRVRSCFGLLFYGSFGVCLGLRLRAKGLMARVDAHMGMLGARQGQALPARPVRPFHP